VSIKQFEQELSKGLPSHAYLFYSSESFLLYSVVSSLKELHGDTAFNFDSYDIKSPDDALPMEQIVDVLNTLPFLAERRTVVLKNVQKLTKKEAKKLEAYLLDPSPSSLLVMLFEGASPKLFDAAALKQVKSIALTVQGRDVPLWVKAQAKKKGIQLTDRAVEYLISIAGADLGILAAELEKLSCLDSSRILEADDLRGMIYSGADYNAFDLLDALRKRNAGEVFRIFEQTTKSQDPQMLLGAMNYHYARQATSSSFAGGRPAETAGVFTMLHEADVALKSSHKYVIEDLLVKLLRKQMK
jgi:DNA polymerase-3 subunit delta